MQGKHLLRAIACLLLARDLSEGLGGHPKTGHTWSLQNRP